MLKERCSRRLKNGLIILFIPLFHLTSEELSWSEIAFRVLENSPEIRVQAYEPKIQSENIEKAKSEFKPVFNGQLQTSQIDGDGDLSVTTPAPANSTFDNTEDSTQLDLTLQQKLKYGTLLELNGNLKRQDSEITSPNIRFQGKDDSETIALGLRQPILEGRGSDIQERRLRQANLALEISQHQLSAYAETIIYNTLLRSLDLFYHLEHIKVIKETLKLEEREYQHILNKIETGVLAKTEKHSAEASMSQRKQMKILAQNAAEQAKLDLVHSLSPNPTDLWEYTITFPEFEVPQWANILQMNEHLNLAQQQRHDLQQAEHQLKMKQLDVVYYKNGLLPKLDFFTSLGYSDYDRRDAFNAIDTKGHGIQYQVGLQLEMPLFKQGEQASLQQAKFQQSQAEASIQNLKRILERDIRKVYTEYLTFKEQFQAAETTRQLRQQSLDTELARRDQGLSTSLQVERARNEFLNSQLQEIEVKVNEFKTRLTLFYKDGSLLSRLNLKL